MESIHLTEITRNQAEIWLGQTDLNRSISDRAIGFMTKDMDDGRWQSAVAPPIFIDEVTGSVLDGQHRLRAFLKSSKPVFTSYLAEVPRRSIEVIDTGRSRTLADTLRIRGHVNTQAKSAWLNRGVQWAFGVKVSHVLTRQDQVQIIESSPNVEKASEVGGAMRSGHSRKILHIPTGTTACLWDMQEYANGGDAVLEFIKQVQSNQGLDELMSRLQVKLLDASNPRSKLTMSPDTISYLVARVYNSWANDEELTKMYARRQAVEELPGYTEWVEANFPTMI